MRNVAELELIQAPTLAFIPPKSYSSLPQLKGTAITRDKDTRCEDILDVRIMHLGTKHYILTAVVPLSKDNLM